MQWSSMELQKSSTISSKIEVKLNNLEIKIDKILTDSEKERKSDIENTKSSYAEITNKMNDFEKKIPSTKFIITELTRQTISEAKDTREYNHIIHGIPDDVDLEKYLAGLYKDTLHCKIPSKYVRLGKVNSKYKVSKRIVKITYESISEKQNIYENLRQLKDSAFSSLHFSDDYNLIQREELNKFKSMAKADNESNTNDSIFFTLRGTPLLNLKVVSLPIRRDQ